VRVLIVSGIWPPDVGGPASHAPDVAGFLAARGNDVEVVTTAARAPAPEDYPVHWIRRAWPVGVRHVQGVALVRARARRADVVYAAHAMSSCSARRTFSARARTSESWCSRGAFRPSA
jgi:hypothetical protein